MDCVSVQLAWFPGSLALLIVTIVFTGALAWSDHQLVMSVDDLDNEIETKVAALMEENSSKSVEAHRLEVYGIEVTSTRWHHQQEASRHVRAK